MFFVFRAIVRILKFFCFFMFMPNEFAISPKIYLNDIIPCILRGFWRKYNFKMCLNIISHAFAIIILFECGVTFFILFSWHILLCFFSMHKRIKKTVKSFSHFLFCIIFIYEMEWFKWRNRYHEKPIKPVQFSYSYYYAFVFSFLYHTQFSNNCFGKWKNKTKKWHKY